MHAHIFLFPPLNPRLLSLSWGFAFLCWTLICTALRGTIHDRSADFTIRNLMTIRVTIIFIFRLLLDIHWILNDLDCIRRDVKVVLSARLLHGCNLRTQIGLVVLLRLLACNIEVRYKDVRFDFCLVLIDWMVRLSERSQFIALKHIKA